MRGGAQPTGVRWRGVWMTLSSVRVRSRPRHFIFKELRQLGDSAMWRTVPKLSLPGLGTDYGIGIGGRHRSIHKCPAADLFRPVRPRERARRDDRTLSDYRRPVR